MVLESECPSKITTIARPAIWHDSAVLYISAEIVEYGHADTYCELVFEGATNILYDLLTIMEGHERRHLMRRQNVSAANCRLQFCYLQQRCWAPLQCHIAHRHRRCKIRFSQRIRGRWKVPRRRGISGDTGHTTLRRNRWGWFYGCWSGRNFCQRWNEVITHENWYSRTFSLKSSREANFLTVIFLG